MNCITFAALAIILAASGCSSSRERRGGDGGIVIDSGSTRDGAMGRDGPVDCAPCAAPPPGCNYTDACLCSGLVCDEVACGTAESRFPTFDRGCETDSGCTIGMHMINCCGSMHAMGIATSETSRFAAAEEACQMMYPGCGCAAQPTVADDGTTGDFPVVRCVGGTCTTTFAP